MADKISEIERLQMEHAQSKRMWYQLFSCKPGEDFVKYIKKEIESLRDVLENKNDEEARAEIRVYRKILNKYNEYDLNK